MSDPMSKAERLAIAGAIAPTLRSTPEAVKARRIARVDADGNVVGYTTVAEVQAALLEARKIELDTEEGVRPEVVVCPLCGRSLKVGTKGRLPTQCRPGKGCQKATRPAKLEHIVPPCECGAVPVGEALKKAFFRGRRDESYRWKCRGCYTSASSDPPTCACGKPKTALATRCRACTRRQPRACACGTALSQGNKTGKCGPCHLASVTKHAPQATCITCPAVPSKERFSAREVKQRKGRPWQCFACSHPKGRGCSRQ